MDLGERTRAGRTCFDVYLNDPWETADPADYETEACFIR